jgi:hypothetical protein
MAESLEEQREKVAVSCRILAMEGWLTRFWVM